MPNVRASSGMIGTIRGPSSGSRMRFLSIRVKAIVVDTGVEEPAANSASNEGFTSGNTTGWTRRTGSVPPSARRRSWRYWTSSESGPGW